jgi:F-type H+-transporting ATPase subunit c
MKHLFCISGLLSVLPGVVMAAEGDKAAGGNGNYFAVTVAVAAIGLALAAFGGAIGQGNLAARAMESIARQPEAAGRIQTAMLLGLAFIESLVIYCLLIAFILLFVNPFLKHLG